MESGEGQGSQGGRMPFELAGTFLSSESAQNNPGA